MLIGWMDFFISEGIIKFPYIKWIKQRNLIGRICIIPFIIFTLPEFLAGFIPSIFFQSCKKLFYMGLKGDE